MARKKSSKSPTPRRSAPSAAILEDLQQVLLRAANEIGTLLEDLEPQVVGIVTRDANGEERVTCLSPVKITQWAEETFPSPCNRASLLRPLN